MALPDNYRAVASLCDTMLILDSGRTMTLTDRMREDIIDRMTRAVGGCTPGDQFIEVKRFRGGFYPCRIRHTAPMPADGKFVVYGLIDPRDGSIFYVGQTEQFLNRMRIHCQELPSRRSPPLERRKLAIAADGHPIDVAILIRPKDKGSADFLEHFAIQLFKDSILNVMRNRWRHESLYE